MQAGGFMQAARWSLGAQQVDSRSGEFRVTGADEAATTTASQAFAADIAAAFGGDFHHSQASDHLDARFIADQKKRSGLSALIGVAILSGYARDIDSPDCARPSDNTAGTQRQRKAGRRKKRRPAREELSTPDASARKSKPVREPMAARVASACLPYVQIAATAREILPPRDAVAGAPV